MDKKDLEAIIRATLKSMEGQGSANPKTASSGGLSVKDFPLQEKSPELIKSRTGKNLGELTLEGLTSGKVSFADFQIAPVTLEYQAQIADAAKRPQIADNLRRSKELVDVSDDEILALYAALRPYRSTKAQLVDYAEHLEKEHNAVLCAQLFREAAEVYEKRGMLYSE
jgi:propanediol dehydratase small subunit